VYFEPKYEEFRPRTIWSLSNAFTSAFKEIDPIPIQGDGETGRVPGGSVLAGFLTTHGGAGLTRCFVTLFLPRQALRGDRCFPRPSDFPEARLNEAAGAPDASRG
jgi:hypothetical protein